MIKMKTAKPFVKGTKQLPPPRHSRHLALALDHRTIEVAASSCWLKLKAYAKLSPCFSCRLQTCTGGYSAATETRD